MKTILPRRASVFAVLLAGCAISHAATVTSTWTSATSGVWNDDARWTNSPLQGGFPNNGSGGGATYGAVINAVGTNYTVTLGTNITIEALTLSSVNATVNHTPGTFTATAGVACRRERFK